MLMITLSTHGHENHTSNDTAQATYLGNEGVMVTNGDTKIVFDPFFHNDYNTYQLVPEDIRTALFNNQAPYNDIDAIFISHAHGDHFSAEDMFKYLEANKQSRVIAPKQAIDKLLSLPESESIKKQVTSIALAFGDQPKTLNIDELTIDAVRIPHAGWPGRADIENLVFRVTLDDTVTVMHMGDADPNDSHYAPLTKHWQKTTTDTAFPPYWFFGTPEGNDILDNRLNVKQAIGVHVPVKVPVSLKDSGKSYFSMPGEHRAIHLKNRENAKHQD